MSLEQIHNILAPTIFVVATRLAVVLYTYFILICATLSIIIKGFNNIYRLQRYKLFPKQTKYSLIRFID